MNAPSPDDETLHELWREAAAAWPTVHLAADAYVEHVADKVRATGVAPETLHGRDLYLARAAAGGDDAAIAMIERTCFAHVDGALAGMRDVGALKEDAKQILRWEFFVRPPGGLSKLTGYDGRGPLQAWLATAAVRIATRLLRPSRRELPDEGALLAVATSATESDWIRAASSETWKRIVSEATASLEARDRLLLCQHYVEDLSIDRLGELHGVHRATAARWVDKARRELRKAIVKRLEQDLRLPPEACESLIRFVMSDLSLTMSALRRR